MSERENLREKLEYIVGFVIFNGLKLKEEVKARYYSIRKIPYSWGDGVIFPDYVLRGDKDK